MINSIINFLNFDFQRYSNNLVLVVVFVQFNRDFLIDIYFGYTILNYFPNLSFIHLDLYIVDFIIWGDLGQTYNFNMLPHDFVLLIQFKFVNNRSYFNFEYNLG